MEKYTYKDIIINPNSEEAMACIGKEIYFHDRPNECLYYANNNNTVYCGTLKEINTGIHNPFVYGINAVTWGCIILKKEEPKPEPEYVPFESSDEFLKAFCDSIQNDVCTPVDARIRFLGGIWLKQKYGYCCDYCNVMKICDKLGLAIGGYNPITNWNSLLKNYTFLDGTPCGKIKE